MVLSMSTVAFAAQGTNDNSGSITINDAVEGHTYNAYQVLVLESYNTDAGAYSYKANAAWKGWLESQTQYVSIDAQGYVTWVKDADAAAFAKQLLRTRKKQILSLSIQNSKQCDCCVYRSESWLLSGRYDAWYTLFSGYH